MNWAKLMSTDERFSPLLPESGLRDGYHSATALRAARGVRRIDSLACARHGVKVVAMVADDEVIVLGLWGAFEWRASRALAGARLVSGDSHSEGQRVLITGGPRCVLLSDVPAAAASRLVTVLGGDPNATVGLEEVPAEALPQGANNSWARAATEVRRRRAGQLRPPQTPPGPAVPSAPPPPTRPPPAPPQPPSRSPSPPDTRPMPPPGPTGPAFLVPEPLTWQAAEHRAVDHMRSIGFGDATVTSRGADGGYDVRATGAVAQVKHWNKPVGRPELQGLFGIASAQHALALFYSSSGYTAAAREWASTTGMALFTTSPAGRFSSESAAAHQIASRSVQPAGRTLGRAEKRRADRYRTSELALRAELAQLRQRQIRKTQSRSSRKRQTARIANEYLAKVGAHLDEADRLPPADRQREDHHKASRRLLRNAKGLL